MGMGMGMGMGKMGMGGMGKMGMGMGMGMGKTPAVEVDPVVEEEAAAVGDPHLTQSNGVMSDLEPEDLSLVDSLGMGMGMGKMGMGKMGMGKMGMGKMGMGMGMGKKPSVEVDPIIEEEAAAVG